jgi:hypothetical protein
MMDRDEIEALCEDGGGLGRQEVDDLLELHDAHARLTAVRGTPDGGVAEGRCGSATAPYRGPSGGDQIAPGPDLSSQRMMDDVARALGWRTDFACGDSPITWNAALEEIRVRSDLLARLQVRAHRAIGLIENIRIRAGNENAQESILSLLRLAEQCAEQIDAADGAR